MFSFSQSSKNTPVFLLIVGHPWSPPVFITLRKLVICVVSHGCHCKTPWIKVSVRSSCYTPNYPYPLFIRLSVCLAVLYDPAHFPLTFHFLYSHPVSGTTALCDSVCTAFSVYCHRLVQCRGCAHTCQLRHVYYPSGATRIIKLSFYYRKQTLNNTIPHVC